MVPRIEAQYETFLKIQQHFDFTRDYNIYGLGRWILAKVLHWGSRYESMHWCSMKDFIHLRNNPVLVRHILIKVNHKAFDNYRDQACSPVSYYVFRKLNTLDSLIFRVKRFPAQNLIQLFIAKIISWWDNAVFTFNVYNYVSIKLFTKRKKLLNKSIQDSVKLHTSISCPLDIL